MTNPKPEAYYVYTHTEIGTGNIVYVGHGIGDRAWAVNNRGEDHKRYLLDMVFEGITPDEWTTIVAKGLTKEEACKIELELIYRYDPCWNKVFGEKLLKVTPEMLDEAWHLREIGYSFKEIANQLDIGTMTIHRAMSGKSPALERIIARTN